MSDFLMILVIAIWGFVVGMLIALSPIILMAALKVVLV